MIAAKEKSQGNNKDEEGFYNNGPPVVAPECMNIACITARVDGANMRSREAKQLVVVDPLLANRHSAGRQRFSEALRFLSLSLFFAADLFYFGKKKWIRRSIIVMEFSPAGCQLSYHRRK